ncbi:MAG: hypothetical protein U0798_10160 [Gemmataceae bacterium]
MVTRIICCLVLLFPQAASAAVLVVMNGTDGGLSFTLDRGNGKSEEVRLAKGESKPITVGRNALVTFSSADAPTTLKLNAYSAYVFTKKRDVLSLKEIELAGQAVPLKDTPEQPPAEPPAQTVKLKLYVDDATPLARRVWEPKLKSRVERATAIVTAATGIQFEIAEIGGWKSDPEAETLEKLLTEFEDKVKFEAGTIQIGFTHRFPAKPNETTPTLLGKTLAPLRPHLLIREAGAHSEIEQVEVLAHELGHWLGAVNTPDLDSVMRGRLGDGRAVLASFKVRFDPLNTLAMNLWAAERASGKVKTWQSLTPTTQARLARIYETLAKADPAERQSEAITALIASQMPDAVAAANPNPNPNANPNGVPNPKPLPGTAAPARPKNTKEEAIRRVLRGITIRANDNAAKPAESRLKGDDLTVELIKTAADIAMAEEETMQVPAFAVAIGIGLDDSTILRNNPLTKQLCVSVETETEFAERSKLIAAAMLHGRRDSCQHFVVSCALTDLVGPELAKQAGLAKELQDMKGASGFSFCDLCIDYGGVEFIERMKRDKHLIARVKTQFRVKDYVPSMEGLEEGFTAKQFNEKFGSISDPRYKAMVSEIDKRVKSLGGYVK